MKHCGTLSPSTHVPLASRCFRSHVPEMAATKDARQRSRPIRSMRRRNGLDSTGSAGGWGGGDAILSALEGPGHCRSRRGCRVTWHSESLNSRAGAAAPVVEQVRAPLVPDLELSPTRQLASSSCRRLSSLASLSRSVCRELERRRPGDAPDPFCSCPSQVPLPPWASPSPPSSPVSLARNRCAF